MHQSRPLLVMRYVPWRQPKQPSSYSSFCALFLVALLSATLCGAQPAPTSFPSWQPLKTDLSLLKTKLKNSAELIENLKNDNALLGQSLREQQVISSQQEERLTTLSNSLTASLQQSQTLKEHTKRLTLSRNIWRVVTIVATLLGVVGWAR